MLQNDLSQQGALIPFRAFKYVLWVMVAFSGPIRSTKPLQTRVANGIWNNLYLMRLLPELITKIFLTRAFMV